MEILELINNGSKLLKDKKIYSHRLDSEILLSKVLKKTREELIISLEQKITPQEISEFNTLIDRRSLKEPIAYILKEKEFWSKKFLVNYNTTNRAYSYKSYSIYNTWMPMIITRMTITHAKEVLCKLFHQLSLSIFSSIRSRSSLSSDTSSCVVIIV